MHTWIFDDFLKDPVAEREKALAQEYKPLIRNGITYPGICLTEDKTNLKKIERRTRCRFSDESIVMYRRYLKDDINETFIHSDVLIADFTAILFLNLPNQCQGGTALWQHLKYGFENHPEPSEVKARGLEPGQELWDEFYEDGFDEKKWKMTRFCPMKFNRLFIFWSSRYHSRFPKIPFGIDTQDARLIKVFFCKVKNEASPALLS